MKHTDEHIRQLFTEKLGNVEGEVPDALWQSVSANLPVASAAPVASVYGIIKLIAAIAVAAAAAVGIYYVTDQKDPETVVVTNVATSASEEKATSQPNSEPVQSAELPPTIESESLESSFTQTVSMEKHADVPERPIEEIRTGNALPPSGNSVVIQNESDDAEDKGDDESQAKDGGTGGQTQAVSKLDATFNTVCVDKEMKQYFFMPAMTDASEYHWDFGDGESSDAMSPQHIYGQEGIYRVTLTINDDAGGVSTESRDCEVIIPGRINIPQNVIITPNGDGLNDLFDVMAYSEGIAFQKIQIRSTSGNIIFESDGSEMWAGQDMSGAQCTGGYYQYLVRGIDRNQEIREKRGVVYLQK